MNTDKRRAIPMMAVLAALTFLAGCKPPDRPARPATPAAESPAAKPFSMPSLAPGGGTVDLDSFRGQVVLLDFWATWCPPCRAELPSLNRLYGELKDRGFVIVGLTLDQGSVEQVAAAVQRFALDYPVGLANPAIAEAYGGVRAIPTKFLLDKSGKVRQFYQGIVPDPQLRAAIVGLLDE